MAKSKHLPITLRQQMYSLFVIIALLVLAGLSSYLMFSLKPRNEQPTAQVQLHADGPYELLDNKQPSTP